MGARKETGFTSAGFTLIELSIVLVIIGLIVGGVLVGRDLIRAAEIRATIKQFEEFEAAANTFKVKYRYLPGDLPNAGNFGFDGSSSGNGDGIIGHCSHSGTCTQELGTNYLTYIHESIDFWYQLGVAGLISFSAKTFDTVLAETSGQIKSGKATPPAKIKGMNSLYGAGWNLHAEVMHAFFASGTTFTSMMPAHNFLLGTVPFLQFAMINNGAYTPVDIYAIDQKLDDGLPISGKVRAVTSVAYVVSSGNVIQFSVGAGPTGSANCTTLDTNPRQYNIQYTGTGSGLCGMAIKASF